MRGASPFIKWIGDSTDAPLCNNKPRRHCSSSQSLWTLIWHLHVEKDVLLKDDSPFSRMLWLDECSSIHGVFNRFGLYDGFKA